MTNDKTRERKKTLADGIPVVAPKADEYIERHEAYVIRREQRTPTLPCIPIVELCSEED
jgi:hypothetical protein